VESKETLETTLTSIKVNGPVDDIR